jgi:hypothetical protein
MRRTLLCICCALAALAAVPGGLGRTALPSPDDTIETGPNYNKGEPLPIQQPPVTALAPEEPAPTPPAQIGDERF